MSRAMDTVLQNHLEWFPAAVMSSLSTQDTLNFSSAAQAFRVFDLKPVTLPGWETDKTWNGDRLVYSARPWQTITGPSGTMHVDSGMDENTPVTAHTIFCTFDVRDQGWGNEKGMVSIVDESAPGGFKDNGEPLPAKAPDDYQRRPPCVVTAVNVPHSNKRVCLKYQTSASTGPHVLWYRVGGGGGHALTISNCRLHALVYRQPS